MEDKIDQILLGQKHLYEIVKLFLPDLTSGKGVMHFLEITRNTFNNYMNNGVFIEGKHFIKEGGNKVFIPDAIIELKKSGIKGKRKTSNKQDTLDAVNQQLGMI